MKLSFLLCFIFLYSSKSSVGEDVPIVKVKQGLVQGIKDTSLDGEQFYSYLGIPFAEPPVGKLRFKEPVPQSPWEGILKATKNPPMCLQKDILEVISEDNSNVESFGQEDCLYLNVHTPEPGNIDANLPVMVFIHGGGFFCWSAEVFGPKALVNDEVILVVIQYRLGIFGFFSAEDSVLPGNMGLKDQQLALKWIKENIKEFGGNPERITIFGESAGAASVHYQILSPGSKGLFQRAIIQSGTALCPWAITNKHKKFAIDVGNSLGCPLSEGTEKFLNCIQKADAHKLLDLSFTTFEWGLFPTYVLPRIDGEFLPSSPEVLHKEKRYNKVDVIIGITQHEGSFLFPWFEKNPTLISKVKNNFEKYGPMSISLSGYSDSAQMAEKIYKYYLNGDLNSLEVDDNLQKLLTDAQFGACQDVAIRLFAEDSDVSLYVFRMDHFGEFSLMDFVPEVDRRNWVAHTDELVYLFSGGLFFNFTFNNEEDLKFKDIITSLWRNFARTGNPTPKGSEIKWDRIKGPKEWKQLSLTANPKMIDYDFNEERKVWSSLRTKQNVVLGFYDDSYDQRSKAEL